MQFFRLKELFKLFLCVSLCSIGHRCIYKGLIVKNNSYTEYIMFYNFSDVLSQRPEQIKDFAAGSYSLNILQLFNLRVCTIEKKFSTP